MTICSIRKTHYLYSLFSNGYVNLLPHWKQKYTFPKKFLEMSFFEGSYFLLAPEVLFLVCLSLSKMTENLLCSIKKDFKSRKANNLFHKSNNWQQSDSSSSVDLSWAFFFYKKLNPFKKYSKTFCIGVSFSYCTV